MNRKNILAENIVDFLEYHNRPNWLGIYNKVQDGFYPIHKMNLEEPQLWLMVADFFSTYRIDNKKFRHDSDFFRSAIKKNFTDNVRRFWTKEWLEDDCMTVAFLIETARRGIWDENSVLFELSRSEGRVKL